jgi:hypothetical protein
MARKGRKSRKQRGKFNVTKAPGQGGLQTITTTVVNFIPVRVFPTQAAGGLSSWRFVAGLNGYQLAIIDQ